MIRNIRLPILFSMFIIILLLVFPTPASACTYEGTITNNRLVFKITSDIEKLAVIQYIRQSGNSLVTDMQGPAMEQPWTFFNDPLCNVYVGFPVGCRQIRNEIQYGVLGTGAFWQWSNFGYTPYYALPNGIYTLDFDTAPSYASIGIEYGILEGNQPWTFCTRTGDITTPIPTPVPSPTPVPVTKTVFAPGITSTWNADALINCNPNPTTEWTLAPYAEDVYRPLIQALQESGTNLLEFYYDWRKSPADTATILANYINENTGENEKVDYFGHSMGGLVGKSYLDKSQGVKIANFLTVGTPYKGSALAYPPWEGGDVLSNNLLEKIAITLYLKHCGDPKLTDRENIRKIVPSLQSLLPVDPYLQDKKSNEARLPINDENLNNWFADMKQDDWNVRVGNIVGKGVETLQIIQTKDPNKKEKLNGDWIDGKLAGRINSDGDGTVLATSAVLDNADEIIPVNQTHRGLVNSVEGMSAVLKFLNLPENIASQTNTPLEEPNSALIVIGYPADFVITDQNGKSKNAKDGMVAIMNPKSGNYKLNLLSKSGNTQLIVAQFLRNGDVKYKEYNFKGIGPRFKTLKFNLQNPKEDILSP